MDSLDHHYDERAVQFMKVLFSLVCAVNKWFPWQPASSNIEPIATNTSVIENAETESQKETEKETVEEFFVNYLKLKQTAAGDFDEDVTEEVTGSVRNDGQDIDHDGTEEEMEVDEKTDPEKHVQIVMGVSEE